jgi:hypothetical protein
MISHRCPLASAKIRISGFRRRRPGENGTLFWKGRWHKPNAGEEPFYPASDAESEGELRYFMQFIMQLSPEAFLQAPPTSLSVQHLLFFSCGAPPRWSRRRVSQASTMLKRTSGNASDFAASIHACRVPSSLTRVIRSIASLTHSTRMIETDTALRLSRMTSSY